MHWFMFLVSSPWFEDSIALYFFVFGFIDLKIWLLVVSIECDLHRGEWRNRDPYNLISYTKKFLFYIFIVSYIVWEVDCAVNFGFWFNRHQDKGCSSCG